MLRNGFKRFASCRATHASIEAAQGARGKLQNQPVRSVVAYVNPITLVAAGNMSPRTGLEGRFSVSFCISLALLGYRLSPFDFSDDVLATPAVSNLIPKISCVAVPGQSETAARLVITLESGETVEHAVENVLGHPDRPLGWTGLKDKFLGLVEPVLGKPRAQAILAAVEDFGRSGQRGRDLDALLSPDI